METIERSVILPTDLEEAWDLLTRPEDVAAWLGDEVVLEPTPGSRGRVLERDGTDRALVVEEVAPGERLTWRWWIDGQPETASRVEITLAPSDAGTIVRVIEVAPTRPALARPGLPMASDAWAHRLLNLESLLLVAAAVRGG